MVMSLLASISPWLCGGLVAATFSRRRCQALGLHIINFAVGGMFGLLLCGLLAWLMGLVNSRSAISVLSDPAIWVAGLCAVSFACVCSMRGAGKRAVLHAMSAACLFVFIFWLIQLSHLAFVPVQAWDAVEFWAGYADAYLLAKGDAQVLLGSSSDKHPMTIIWLNVWLASVLEDTGVSRFLVSNSLIYASICLTVIGHSICFSGRDKLAIIACSVAVSLPLIENHIFNPGYVEIWLGFFLLATSVYLSVAIQLHLRGLFLPGVSCLVALVLIKNTGLVISLAAVTGVALACAMHPDSRRWFLRGPGKIIAMLAAGLIAVSLVNVASTLQTVESYLMVKLVGRELFLGLPAPQEVLSILLTALFRNQSFSIMPMLIIVVIFEFIGGASRGSCNTALALVLALFTAVFGVTVLSLFTDAGLQHALPGADTGFSRSLIPAALVTPIVLQLGWWASNPLCSAMKQPVG